MQRGGVVVATYLADEQYRMVKAELDPPPWTHPPLTILTFVELGAKSPPGALWRP